MFVGLFFDLLVDEIKWICEKRDDWAVKQGQIVTVCCGSQKAQ